LQNNISFNVIICDDERLIRQAHSRTVNTVCKSLGIKVNIIESEDGIETLYLFYKSIIQGDQISLIFSDENMNFINGTQSSVLIRDICIKKRINLVPFYLVSSFDENYIFNKNNSNNNENITNIIKKPLCKDDLIKIV
jgi:DNA-binding LytR/AlgR family response regulator